jgi:hypothetical protein
MKSTSLPDMMSSPLMTMRTPPVGTDAAKPTIRVKELSERDRRRLLMHFLALDNSDRLLRFGTVLPDELITRYVQHLDFSRDTVFGVYDDNLRLTGVRECAWLGDRLAAVRARGDSLP